MYLNRKQLRIWGAFAFATAFACFWPLIPGAEQLDSWLNAQGPTLQGLNSIPRLLPVLALLVSVATTYACVLFKAPASYRFALAAVVWAGTLTLQVFISRNYAVPMEFGLTGMVAALSLLDSALYLMHEQRALAELPALTTNADPLPLVHIPLEPIEPSPETAATYDLTFLTLHFQNISNLIDSHGSVDSVKWLNANLTELENVIVGAQGSLSRFEGNCWTAHWGSGAAPPVEAARQAVECALALQDRVASLNRKPVDSLNFPLRITIAIHSQKAIVGILRNRNNNGFSLVGNALETTEALEPFANEFGIPIAMSETTYTLIKDLFVSRYLGVHSISQQPFKLYEPFCLKSSIAAGEAEIRASKFTQAVLDYEAGHFDSAFKSFSELEMVSGRQDPAAFTYRQRSVALLESTSDRRIPA